VGFVLGVVFVFRGFLVGVGVGVLGGSANSLWQPAFSLGHSSVINHFCGKKGVTRKRRLPNSAHDKLHSCTFQSDVVAFKGGGERGRTSLPKKLNPRYKWVFIFGASPPRSQTTTRGKRRENEKGGKWVRKVWGSQVASRATKEMVTERTLSSLLQGL